MVRRSFARLMHKCRVIGFRNARRKKRIGMLYTWGLLMHKWRYVVISICVLIFLIAAPAAANVMGALSSGFGLADTESQQGLAVLRDELGAPSMSMVLAFNHPSHTYQEPEYANSVQQILRQLKDTTPEIVSISSPYLTQDIRMVGNQGHTIYALILFNTSLEDGMELVPEIRKRVNQTPFDDSLEVFVTGEAAIFYDMNVTSEQDLQRAEAVALPVLLVVLVIVFGSLIAAGLPVIIGAFSIIITLACVFVLAQSMSISIFVLNISSLLGLGVAVDYALLMITRMREELETRDVVDALGVTVSTAGKAIVFSSLTSILGLSALLLFDLSMLQSLGIGGVLVISISMVMALTLLPAILSVVGHKIDSLRVLPKRKLTGGYWYALSRWVMRHPIAVFVPLVILLVLLGTPFLRVKLGVPWVNILPVSAESRAGWDLLSSSIGEGQTSPILMVYQSPTSIYSAENLAALRDTTDRLDGDSRVTSVDSIARFETPINATEYSHLLSSGNGHPDQRIRKIIEQLSSESAALIRIYTTGSPVSDEVASLVQELRDTPTAGDMSLYVSGSAADMIDTIDSIYSDFPLAILYIFGSTYVLLFLLFRSVLLPLKAVLMNALSITASYGALVLIFQDGNLQNVLSFTSSGIIEATAPIVLFCVIFGLSMDYEVFLWSRVKELYDKSQDNTQSVSEGLERTGSIITSAALLMVIVCGSFAFADIVIVKLLGVGLGIAIAIDASIVRALIVPALMRLMGRLNWWAPRFGSSKGLD